MCTHNMVVLYNRLYYHMLYYTILYYTILYYNSLYNSTAYHIAGGPRSTSAAPDDSRRTASRAAP